MCEVFFRHSQAHTLLSYISNSNIIFFCACMTCNIQTLLSTTIALIWYDSRWYHTIPPYHTTYTMNLLRLSTPTLWFSASSLGLSLRPASAAFVVSFPAWRRNGPSVVTFATQKNAENPPKDYRKTYRLQGETLSGGNPTGVRVTTDTGHVLQTDVPTSMGGLNRAPQPVETLLAAWMGCTQATALFVGRQMGMPVSTKTRKPQQTTTTTTTNQQQPQQSRTQQASSTRLLLDRLVFVDIQAERDERGALTLPIVKDQAPPVPSRITRLTGTIVVYRRGGEPITPSEMHMLQQQTEWRCPVANMMAASGCQMDVAWVDGASISHTRN